jgi:hypothetical protein
MVEYGNGVSQGAGNFAGGQGGGPSGVDAGDNIASMFGGVVNDAATTIAGLPPVVVALGAAVLVLATLMVLRRVL